MLLTVAATTRITPAARTTARATTRTAARTTTGITSARTKTSHNITSTFFQDSAKNIADSINICMIIKNVLLFFIKYLTANDKPAMIIEIHKSVDGKVYRRAIYRELVVGANQQ